MILSKTRSLLVFGMRVNPRTVPMLAMGVLMLQIATAMKECALPVGEADVNPADWACEADDEANALWSQVDGCIEWLGEECPKSNPRDGIAKRTCQDFCSEYKKFFRQICNRDSGLRNVSTVTGSLRGLAKAFGHKELANLLKYCKYGYKVEVLGKDWADQVCSFIASLAIKTALSQIYRDLGIKDYALFTFILTCCTKQLINSYVKQTGYESKLSKALRKWGDSVVGAATGCMPTNCCGSKPKSKEEIVTRNLRKMAQEVVELEL